MGFRALIGLLGPVVPVNALLVIARQVPAFAFVGQGCEDCGTCDSLKGSARPEPRGGRDRGAGGPGACLVA